MFKNILIGILAIATLAFGTYSLGLQKKVKTLSAANPVNQAGAQIDVKALLAEVGKQIDLPKDEEPTVATVTDPSKLEDNPFFVNAKVGHRLIIYPKSQKAILYDADQHKIINLAAAGAVSNPPPSPAAKPEKAKQ